VGGEWGVVPPTHCRLSGYFPGTPYIGVLLEWQPPSPCTPKGWGENPNWPVRGAVAIGAPGEKPPLLPFGAVWGEAPTA